MNWESLVSSIEEIVLDPGDVFVRDADPNDWVYIVESGELSLSTKEPGKPELQERRGAGVILGNLSTKENQALSVEALTPCRVFKVAASHILGRLERLDPILRACMETSVEIAARFAPSEDNKMHRPPYVNMGTGPAQDLIEQFRLEHDLLNGLENGQFSMAYQPIVRLEDARMVGFESLMRWQHPVYGNVRPDRFIDVAETMGTICVLTEFALAETCAALRRIRDLDPKSADLFASINISGQDIARRGFVEFLSFVLDQNDLNPETVKLEVTEHAMISESSTTLENLDALQSLGCGISIDDFGTGYSNLGRLKTLPLTALKIDRAFAGEAHSNTVSRSIVRLLVGLGQEMGVDIVAEGLETIEDVQTLRNMGCRFAQGFYFHRPVKEEIFSKMIVNGGTPERMIA